MKIIKTRNSLVVASIYLAAAQAMADVSLPDLFADSMVIQRDTAAPIWGWAEPGEQVAVKPSWGEGATTVADSEGRWMVKLNTPKAGGPHQLEVSGENTIELEDVMSGDVWICSGQSNMAWRVHGALNGRDEMQAANNSMIRQYNVPHTIKETAQEQNNGDWLACSPKNSGLFTAVGYFFAREIYKEEQVPIGLLSINWGGTRIEPWIPPVGFHAVPELADIAAQVDQVNPQTKLGKKAYGSYLSQLKQWINDASVKLEKGMPLDPHPSRPAFTEGSKSPTYIYNGMMSPIVPAAIKGAIWYQGEANGNEGLSYQHKMEALIKGWRSVFNQGDFPFYFVQLANFQKSNREIAEGGDGWARLRQAQLQSMKVANTGMAVAIDLGEANDIHPRNKQDVGKRLARWALANDYGKKDIVPSGPLYKSMKTIGSTAVIEFDYVGSGLMVAKKSGLEPTEETQGASLEWFSIQAEDGKWYKADAKIEGATVVVSNLQVKSPKAVRYAFAMNPEGANLYNKEGLPASPFSTDVLK